MAKSGNKKKKKNNGVSSMDISLDAPNPNNDAPQAMDTSEGKPMKVSQGDITRWIKYLPTLQRLLIRPIHVPLLLLTPLLLLMRHRDRKRHQVLVQRCMEICDEPCISIPGLSDEEVWALPLPEKMLHDKKRRDKKNMSKQIVYDSKLNEFVAWLIEIDAQIDAAKRRGDNLHHFLSEGGRGPNDETTKRLKDGRRVQLDWQIGVPTGPGRWPTYFIRYIGILVRNCEHWNIGFTWEENSYEAVVWTWKSLQHDWQRFYGLPSTVKREQFCYLLWYWESDEAKEKSRIGSENRVNVESDYYGGSQGALQYRYITKDQEGSADEKVEEP